MCKLQDRHARRAVRLHRGPAASGLPAPGTGPLADGQTPAGCIACSSPPRTNAGGCSSPSVRRTLEELWIVLDGFPLPEAGDREHGPGAFAAGDRRARRRKCSAACVPSGRRRRNLEQDRRIPRALGDARVGHPIPASGQPRTKPRWPCSPSPAKSCPCGSRSTSGSGRWRSPLELRSSASPAVRSVAAVVALAERMDEIREAAWRAGTLEFKLPAAYLPSGCSTAFAASRPTWNRCPPGWPS